MAYLNKIVVPDDVGTVTSVNTRIGDVVLGKSDVGLDNADNTSDLDKPISTATQTALDLKVDETITVNGYALSANVNLGKSDVGLGNVDNTSDLDKPISTLQQGALDLKMDLDGSNSNVDVLSFDTTVTLGAITTGQLQYDTGEGTLTLGMNGGNVMQSIGLEQYIRIRNVDSVEIVDGDVVAYFGTIGNSGKINVKRFNPATMLGAYILGIATEHIAINADGLCTYVGKVRGFDTSGTPVSEVWVDNDILWAHPTLAGKMTKVQPTAPSQQISMGIVVSAHGSNGTFSVRVVNIQALSRLTDVYAPTRASGDLLYWNAANLRWEVTKASANFFITPEGGYAIKLINKTGGASVKGYAVTTSDTTDNAARNIVVDVPNPIGVIYESGVADGQPMWVVVSGIAEAYFQNAPTRAFLARGFITGDTGYVSGQIKSEALPTSPFATDKHFYELGHILETKGAPGLAKMVLHFN